MVGHDLGALNQSSLDLLLKKVGGWKLCAGGGRWGSAAQRGGMVGARGSGPARALRSHGGASEQLDEVSVF